MRNKLNIVSHIVILHQVRLHVRLFHKKCQSAKEDLKTVVPIACKGLREPCSFNVHLLDKHLVQPPLPSTPQNRPQKRIFCR